ncbi:IS66 family transposase [Actinocrinis puniceicyclus]|uniref:IS66 family transposase n=1 Tax=Actinocrinis puniceicyclus TaxID=977794 RepID=A0A8J8BG24_9ACTN|nr:IS66 family transposase [Actinocrinis puniceicyclus]MBS2966711.1 IS66 family transposase [Actinocrinis puniceicyclus]
MTTDPAELSREELIAVVRALRSMVDEQVAELIEQGRLVRELVAERDAVRAELAAWRLAAGKDSSNSGRPPSSDSPFVRPKAKASAFTRKSGRKPGKQPGDPSTTLRQVDDPGERIEVPVASCSCGADLSGVPVALVQRRQVFECAPPPPPRVTEYQIAVKLCPCCGARASGAVPAHVTGRVQFGALVKARSVALNLWHHVPFRRTAQLLSQLCAVRISVGALVGYRREAAVRLAPFLDRVRVLLGFEPVLGVDETPAKVGAGLAYVHVARSEQYTVMHVGGRTKADIDAGGVLPGYCGVIMRDGYAGYAHFTDAQHAWCGAHTLRDIKLVHDADPTRQAGLAAMRDSLLLMLAATKTARANGADALDAKGLSFHRACYAGAVNQIRIDNHGRTDPVADAARTLATRFDTHREMILRFIIDLAVPFTNNGSEQEIRPVKIHQRSSGGAWRTLDGLADFATIWSYLITAAKHGIGQLQALTILFEGEPWLPPLPEG